MALLLFIQIVIVNNLRIFGYATPLIIGYMIICFHCNTPRITLIIWGFVVGFLFDIFSDTMGMASASMTLLAFVQPDILSFFMPKDETGLFCPSMKNMQTGNYVLYVLSCMGVLHLVFYFLEAFSLSNFLITLMSMIVSTLVASVIIVLLELIVNHEQKKY